MRLQKYLSQCGISSRRRAEELIKQGVVILNGLQASIGAIIDPEKDVVKIFGKQVKHADKFVYVALNKPVGYISSCSDLQGASVLDLVDINQKIYPVGRLDMGSQGLMILTNDGDLTNKLTHPKYECEKSYEVRVKDALIDSDIDILRIGVELEDGRTKPCTITKIDDHTLVFILKEGKNRQIRRMFDSINNKVVLLNRTRIKNILLGDLKIGDWRELTEDEVSELKK